MTSSISEGLNFASLSALMHGFLVLSETADFDYKCTDFYDPSDEGAILWNDQNLDISWPIEKPILSFKDANAPSLTDLNL